jgi:hypothetical protein
MESVLVWHIAGEIGSASDGPQYNPKMIQFPHLSLQSLLMMSGELPAPFWIAGVRTTQHPGSTFVQDTLK